MEPIRTLANIEEDGTLTARTPPSFPRGRQEVEISIVVTRHPESPGRWRNMKRFRSELGAPAHTGNTVIEIREEERS